MSEAEKEKKDVLKFKTRDRKARRRRTFPSRAQREENEVEPSLEGISEGALGMESNYRKQVSIKADRDKFAQPLNDSDA